MDLNRLHLFVEVADQKGFSKAAKKLGLQRSSISRSIAALEDELDVQLFQRTTRSVSLTTAGEALYANVAAHLTALADAIDELPEREESPSGPLKITVAPDLGAEIFPRAIADFARRYPRVHLDVRATNRVVDLVGEGFDAAVRAGQIPLPDSSMRARLLTRATGAIFASPAYLARAGTPRTLQDTQAHDWVSGPIGPPVAPTRPEIVRADDMLFVREALRQGLGLGVLPDFLAQQDIDRGSLCRLSIPPIFEEAGIWFLSPPGEHVPKKLRVFRDYLVEWFRARPLATTPSRA